MKWDVPAVADEESSHENPKSPRFFDDNRCGAVAGVIVKDAWISRALAQQSGSSAGSEWDYRTTKELVAALQARKISAVELTDHVIARIETLDQKLNAVVVRDFDRGRDAAKAADAALSRGEQRPLLGIPMVVKESFNVAGLPTTWGIPAFKGWTPQQDAVAITRLKAAGAVILGKTNVPINLQDWQSYNDIYGTTNNPWDLGRTPGGSSGGSSAALAAGFGPLSLGSDIAGSLRVPAHYCGVYSHKPTLNLVPLRGHTPPGSAALPRENDLAVVGPMARSAADLASALDVLAGPDEMRAGVGYRLALPAPRHADLKGFRVLVIGLRIRCCRRRHRCAPHSIACRSGSSKRAPKWGTRVRFCPTLQTGHDFTCACCSGLSPRRGRRSRSNSCKAPPRCSRRTTRA